MGNAAILPAIAPKLAKLIPLLASNHDGEVVNTARAIERTLKGAGLDLHALAAALVVQPNSRPSPEPKPRAREPQKSSGPPRWGDLSHLDRICILDWLRFWGELSPWERQFAGSIEDLITQRPLVRLSEKQVMHINDLLRKEWEWHR